MLDRANPDQRKQLDEAIEKKWEAIRGGGDLDAIRRFVSVFGTHFKVGREAQLQLAERLLAAGSPDDLTEAETKLQGLCFSPEVRRQDPPTAAKAIEAMIRVYLKRGFYEDAVGFYKQLGTEFANVPVRDGKTGAELLNETVYRQAVPAVPGAARRAMEGRHPGSGDARGNSRPPR